MSVIDDVERSADQQRTIGAIALGSAVAVAVILGVHPFGSTDLYGDGEKFVDHVSNFWIVIHLAAAVVTLAFPLAVTAWGASLASGSSRVWGGLAGSVATIGTAIGVLHLVGTDTILIAFFQDTVEEAGGEGAISADLVMRLHAATLTAWIIGFWLSVQIVIAVAAWLDRRRGWEFWLPAAGTALLLVSLGLTLEAGQYTTASDMIFFRGAVTLFIIWLGLVGYHMRKASD